MCHLKAPELEDDLANTRSALKRIRSNERKRLRNRLIRSRTRTAVGAARSAVKRGDGQQAEKQVLEAIRQLDRAAERGTIHRNNAARKKSRLMKQLHKVKGAKPV